jgi:transcriptional regulator with XRE-family HTH domain
MAEDIGIRVRRWRKRRRMTQQELADAAGISQTYISQIENCQRTLRILETVERIAAALQIEARDLLNDPRDLTHYISPAGQAMSTIRVALIEIEENERRQAGRSRDEMTAAVRQLTSYRTSGNYPAMAAMLSTTLPDAAAYGGTTQAAVLYNAATCLKNLGYRDLGLGAARLAVQGAVAADHAAWIGATRFIHAVLLPLEAPALAHRSADRAIGDMQGAARDPEARQMLGQLHLAAALTATAEGRMDETDAHLAAAFDEARTLGDPVDGAGFNSLFFGPTNILLWQMAIAAETDDPAKVVEIASKIDVDRLMLADRLFAYWGCLGRALAASGETDGPAQAALLNAERAAPAAFARSGELRDVLSTLVSRAVVGRIHPSLRALAVRVGLRVPS